MYKIKLSPYHKVFYNEWQLDPLSSKYNIVFDQTISKTLDISRLKKALNRLISEYLILNSHVTNINGVPYWVINSKIAALETFDGVANDEQLYRFVSKPFDLENGPLYRFAIFNQKDGSYRFFLVWHHLIMDGASVNIAIKETSNYYNSLLYKVPYTLNKQKDIITNCNNIFFDDLSRNQVIYGKFWDNLLTDIEPVDLRFLKKIPQDNKFIAKKQNPIREIRFSFSKTELTILNRISRKLLTTSYIYSQCIFSIILNFYTSQNKFALCHPVRIKAGRDFICGTKVNTNLCIYDFNQSITIIELLDQIRNFTKSLKSNNTTYSNYPIDQIIERSNKDLLDVIFAVTNLKDTEFNFSEANTLKINNNFNIDIAAKLFFEFEIKNNHLNYRVRYSALDTDEDILKNFIRHYKKLFITILQDLDNNIYKSVYEYQLLSNAEYQKVLYDFNQTQKPYPRGKNIYELFEKQVNKTPDKMAMIYKDVQLTYRELNKKANQLAYYLLTNYSDKKNSVVALLLSRNEDIIIIILAVLKSGLTYVPIDTTHPNERIKYILEDSNAGIIISHTAHINIINDSYSNNKSIILYDDITTLTSLNKYPDNNVGTNHISNKLAYIIYTSGTTGDPKGVMIEHKNVINTIYSLNCIYNSSTTLKTMSVCNYIFDVFVAEALTSLFNGHELHILSEEIKQDIILISSYINNKGIECIYLPPALLTELPQIKYPTLKSIIYAGEPCNSSTVLYWSKEYDLYNYYGPTESTIYSIGRKINDGKSYLIGKPLNNMQAYILNKQLSMLPIGAIGELYLAGDSIARGYLNNFELTQKKFIKNPFYKEAFKNDRLYATGDLACWTKDGEIRYIGRVDSQVKIRGYRVELEEIANKISCYPNIKQSIVVIKNSSNNNANSYIVAYYLSKNKLDETKISDFLRIYLPSYMVPNLFIHITQIPTTLSGKIDYKALPKPNFDSQSIESSKNDSELTVCKIYSEVLNLPLTQISINHDFFELGGNSILAIRLAIKLQHYFKITVNDIFKLRTPAMIAKGSVSMRNNLRTKLEMVKLLYKELEKYNIDEQIKLDKARVQYLEKVKGLDFNLKLKPIHNVLLTGATGYLGCNLLYQLLFNTRYKIYLLIRAQTENLAYERINKKFKFYFDKELNRYKNRIVIITCDIEKANLGLHQDIYKFLTKNIDSIIHSAALVKHYGNYEKFYKSNVQATLNLLDLAKLCRGKDFHYISTKSVLMDGHVPHKKYYIFYEDSIGDVLQNKTNFYVQTKYIGELKAIEYRQYGVNSNIYRVGNLSMNSQNFKNQENIGDSSFFIKIKTILNLGMLPHELSEIEISPVDLTALAIVKLFNQTELSNNTFHVFNPNICNLFELFSNYKNVNVIITSFSEFIDIVLNQLQKDANNEQIELFMLHQSWLQNIDIESYTTNIVLQNKTETILSKLDFKWYPITSKMLSDVINKSFESNQ